MKNRISSQTLTASDTDFSAYLRERLRAGEAVNDCEFDSLYDNRAASLSHVHWTPLADALRAARFLAESPHAKILDVGAGVGKFCLVGALCTEAKFTGVEQRPDLVKQAQKNQSLLKIFSIKFLCQDAFHLDWSAFTGFYFFNPFHELICDEDDLIDYSLINSPQLYRECVTETQRRLAELPVGTRVATLYGFGGEMPAGFVRRNAEPSDENSPLILWEKGY